MHRVSWFTAGTRSAASTGPTSEEKFSWTDGDQSEVTGAQFWFSDEIRKLRGNRVVYYTDGRVVLIAHRHCVRICVHSAAILFIVLDLGLGEFTGRDRSR